MMIKRFQELEVWRKADELAHRVFVLTDTFPRQYLFDLTGQLRRAALSVPANLAEGCATTHTKELLQFINIARRSASESQYLLLFAFRRELIPATAYAQLIKDYDEVHRMLNGLARSLSTSRLTPQPRSAVQLAASLLVFGAVFLGHFSPVTGHWSLGHLVYADVPHLIRYQGQAVDAQEVPLEGPYEVTFRLYDAETGGRVVWQETQPHVPLTDGHFSVLLGHVTPLNVDWSTPLWLSIQVGTEPELTPRQRITSVPFAILAEAADTAHTATVAERLTVPVTTSTITDDANRLIPSGAVMFFNLVTCPAGWNEVTSARGRYLVGLQPGGTLGTGAGTALSNLENRPTGTHGHRVSDPDHDHSYPLSIPGRTSAPGWHFAAWAAYDQNWSLQPGIARGTTGITIQDYAGVPGTNAPYLQFLACQKD